MTGLRRSARLSGRSPSPGPSHDVTSVRTGSKHADPRKDSATGSRVTKGKAGKLKRE